MVNSLNKVSFLLLKTNSLRIQIIHVYVLPSFKIRCKAPRRWGKWRRNVSQYHKNVFVCVKYLSCLSQWPRGLKRRSTVARLLRLWVWIPPGAWIFVCCECCVLSGRGLCDELITHQEESYRLCCVVVCDLETSRMGAPYIYDISHLRVKWWISYQWQEEKIVISCIVWEVNKGLKQTKHYSKSFCEKPLLHLISVFTVPHSQNFERKLQEANK